MKPGIALVLWVALTGVWALAQKPEYDWYPEFRNWMQRQRQQDRSLTAEQMMNRYETRLRGEGVNVEEISRRRNLLTREGDSLEADFWNRFFTEGKANYNTAPNSFLVQAVSGRKPGVALDYGMGEGRNGLYLAKVGWQVYGFDPAEAAVALAQKRAAELGVKLETKVAKDSQYDFGKERFDLILFSWTIAEPELIPKVIDSLKPGGMVVMECSASWVGRNQMLKRFDALQIVQYEIVRAQSDFFGRAEMDVLRLIARKQ